MKRSNKGSGKSLAERINPFIYKNNPQGFKLKPVKTNKIWRRYTVEFPVASLELYPGGEIARGEYYEPLQATNSHLVILTHGWGDHSVIPLKLMVDGLLKNGFACFLFYLPFHASRLPGEMRPRLAHLTPDEWFTGYQMAVTDICQIVDWAMERGYCKIAVAGLSLGAIVSSITMGIDKRITAGVLIVHGGNSGKLLQLSRVTSFRKEYRSSTKEYEENQVQYAKYLKEIESNGWEKVVPDKGNYLIDPLTYAHMLRERPLLMINALWDEFIPKEATVEFRQACGQVEQIWFPSTHASIWAWYPLIVRHINHFLGSSFNSYNC
jgi:esterase/lipase